MVSHVKPSQSDCRILWSLTSNISYYPKQRINLRLINSFGCVQGHSTTLEVVETFHGCLQVIWWLKWDGINQNERFVCLFFFRWRPTCKICLSDCRLPRLLPRRIAFFYVFAKVIAFKQNMFFSIKLS